LLRAAGRLLVPALSRLEITGMANFPRHGPLLVVGNHLATLEVVLMVVYAPQPPEMLGASDIGPPPWMDAITRVYGFISVNRGNFDRAAMTQALDVLRQGGTLGIFPEGGVWDPGAMEAKRGVAWLSYHTGAPVLPIGFGGIEGALDAALKLKRPTLTMNVGKPLPAVTLPQGTRRREGLQAAADRILLEIEALIPEAYREQRPEIVDERFELHLTATDASDHEVAIPASNELSRPGLHADALCKLLYRPWMLHIFAKDLHLPIAPLEHLRDSPDPADLAQALDPILDYVTTQNPGFFTYRFGHRWGIAMEAGLRDLQAVARWAASHGLRLEVRPIRRYRIAGQDEEIVETQPGAAHVW
jgi:1-acyl-sn-glycerol-3-phosphate acyltransferase